ncbi:MAG: CPBP family intramembrane metalloprotease [Bacteroidetes bacterium]|nr:MAG: CPBP family intramembrane metalloprotease [Bacteroidota bacterium]
MMESTISYILLTALLGLGLPLYSLLSGGKRLRRLLEQYPAYRKLVFRQSIIFQWVMVALILLAMSFEGDPLTAIGLGFLSKPVWVAGLLALTALGIWGAQFISISTSKLPKVAAWYRDVLHLIPANRQEYAWAMALSFTAGVCEEIIFRGFLFWQLQQYISLIPAIVVVNLLFAGSHYGTRKRNMLLAFLFGVVASGLFIWTGELWAAMAAHILIDVYSLSRGKKMLDMQRAQAAELPPDEG